MNSNFSRFSAVQSDDYGYIPTAVWILIALMFLCGVASLFAQDVPKVGDVVPIASGTAADVAAVPATVPAIESPKQGGVEVQVGPDGNPRFIVDIAAMDWKRLEGTKWYAKPAEVVRQIGSNTAANVKANPWTYILTGTAAALIASGEAASLVDQAQELLGGGSSDEKKATQTPASASKPTTSVQVSGQYNSVTVPATAIDGPIVVDGSHNDIIVTEPAIVTP